MRIKAEGLHWTPVTLADGTKKTYWYAWRGGPRLSGEYGSPEFIASFNAAIATKVAAPEGRLLSLLQGNAAIATKVAAPEGRLLSLLQGYQTDEPRFSRSA